MGFPAKKTTCVIFPLKKHTRAVFLYIESIELSIINCDNVSSLVDDIGQLV
jgi:hypothetical protein